MKKEIKIGRTNDFRKALKETHYLKKLIQEVGGQLEFDRESKAWVGSWDHGEEKTTKHGFANEFGQISDQIRRVRRYAEVEVAAWAPADNDQAEDRRQRKPATSVLRTPDGEVPPPEFYENL